MGNSNSKKTVYIEKNCKNCGIVFKTISKETITIKGPIHERELCDDCNQRELQKIAMGLNFGN